MAEIYLSLRKVARNLFVPQENGPKGLHETAQGKRGTSAALGYGFHQEKSPEGAGQLCVALSGLCRFVLLTQGGARASLALG